jgi:D-apionolactonase
VGELSRYQRRYGRDEPPVGIRELRAGPLTAQLEGIDLRYIRLAGVELVRRLFVAVRDAAWGTVPPRINDLAVETAHDSFRVSFDAYHEAGDLRYRWQGGFTGYQDGTLACTMAGVADSEFPYNRIGFCVLHPRENAGCPYRARTPDGEIEGALPETIGQQRFAEGKLWPLFPSYDVLEIEVEEGLRARFDFTGDLFEMEDQRNWTDASFKTYSTPITLGWPHQASAGERIEQGVSIVCSGTPSARSPRTDGVTIELGEPSANTLPTIGLGLASHGERLREREAELIRALGPDHIRVDLRFDEDWREQLDLAGDAARALETGLELALFLGGEPEAELEMLAATLAQNQYEPRVERLLAFDRDRAVSDSALVRQARAALASAVDGAAFAAGTDDWFTELNRERPDLADVDAVAYSVCATVHADDDTSVRETPAAQADTVRSAISLFGLPVVVGPVTIRPRRWPFGELEGYAGLPYQVDPRQCALFGAAWTGASLKHLAEAGAAAITYFETTGWRGVLEREQGSLAPDAFRSAPGAVFPLYHVLADVSEWRGRGAVVVPCRSTDPLAVEAFAMQGERGTHTLVCNLAPVTQRFSLEHGARDVQARVLDEESARRAGEDPDGFRAERAAGRGGSRGRFVFELLPYAVAWIDLA